MRSNKFRMFAMFGGAVLGVTLCGATKFAQATPTPSHDVRALAGGDDKSKDPKDNAKKEEEPKGEPVDVDKLPKVVVDAVKKEMPGARIAKAAKLEDGNFYLDDVKVGKKLWDVTVTPKGKIVKKVEMKD